MDTKQSRPRDNFSKMDAMLFALTLEVVLLQLRIHEGSCELRLACQAVDVAGKYQQQYSKLVRDRNTVKDVLIKTLIHLVEKSEWVPLQQAVTSLEQRVSLVYKRKEYEQLKKSQEQTCHELNTMRGQWKLDLRNTDIKVALLRDKMKDDMLNASTRLRYAELWLSARAEAQELRFQQQHARPPPPRTDHEDRVHRELSKVYELQIEERVKATEYRQGRYAEDIASINRCLAEKRQQLSVAITKRTELQALYDLHESEMRSWLSFKELRAARLAREERLRQAATSIQAWWRGVMVRRSFGAFKYLKNLKKSPSKSKKK